MPAKTPLGHRHFIGSRLSETPANNPARIAFEAYFAAEDQRSGRKENKRHCADPATVLYAVGRTKCFGEVGPGACDVREDGFTRWNAGRDKQHFYNTQKLPIGELEEVMEQLLIKPPRHRTGIHAPTSSAREAYAQTMARQETLSVSEIKKLTKELDDVLGFKSDETENAPACASHA